MPARLTVCDDSLGVPMYGTRVQNIMSTQDSGITTTHGPTVTTDQECRISVGHLGTCHLIVLSSLLFYYATVITLIHRSTVDEVEACANLGRLRDIAWSRSRTSLLLPTAATSHRSNRCPFHLPWQQQFPYPMLSIPARAVPP